jgi:hypothetical protein
MVAHQLWLRVSRRILRIRRILFFMSTPLCSLLGDHQEWLRVRRRIFRILRTRLFMVNSFLFFFMASSLLMVRSQPPAHKNRMIDLNGRVCADGHTGCVLVDTVALGGLSRGDSGELEPLIRRWRAGNAPVSDLTAPNDPIQGSLFVGGVVSCVGPHGNQVNGRLIPGRLSGSSGRMATRHCRLGLRSSGVPQCADAEPDEQGKTAGEQGHTEPGEGPIGPYLPYRLPAFARRHHRPSLPFFTDRASVLLPA